MRQGKASVNVRTRRLLSPAAASAGLVCLLAALPLAGCGGGGGTGTPGSFIDINGFQIGTPRGPAPTEQTREAVRHILREIVPPGSTPPVQTTYTFEGGYTATLVWKPGVAGSSGRIDGPTPGLPAVFQVSAVGTTAQYANFSLEYVER